MEGVQGRRRLLHEATYWERAGRALVSAGGMAMLAWGGALAPASAQSTQQSAAPAASLVFDGVTVVDVEQGKLVPAQRVVVTGNRIQTVGDADKVPAPAGAQVIDAGGKYLIPGLWDMHVHPQDTGPDFLYPMFVANGVTGIRDGWSNVPLETQRQWWREILAGTRVGPPRQLLPGASFGQHYATDDSATVAHTLDSLKAQGANFIKLYPFNPMVAAVVRRSGLPFGGHVHGGSAIEASDSGMNIIDHVNSSGDLETLCLSAAASVEQCRPVAEHFRRNNTWWMSSLVKNLSTNGEAETNPGQASHNLIERFHNFSGRFWGDSLLSQEKLRDSLRAVIRPQVKDAVPADSLGFLAIMKRVGLPIVAGTDGDEELDPRPAGFSLHVELAIYAIEGLTPLEALRTATLNPAKLLHGTDSLGTVAPGKLADLVLLDANPLADITNTTTIRAVVTNGRYFDRATLDKLLVEVRTKARKAKMVGNE